MLTLFNPAMYNADGHNFAPAIIAVLCVILALLALWSMGRIAASYGGGGSVQVLVAIVALSATSAVLLPMNTMLTDFFAYLAAWSALAIGAGVLLGVASLVLSQEWSPKPNEERTQND